MHANVAGVFYKKRALRGSFFCVRAAALLRLEVMRMVLGETVGMVVMTAFLAIVLAVFLVAGHRAKVKTHTKQHILVTKRRKLVAFFVTKTCVCGKKAVILPAKLKPTRQI